MPEPTNQGGEGRPGTPGAEDDAGTIQIPSDQVHPALANAPHPGMTQVHPVKINGRDEQWTTQQLIDRAQKESAAEEKFQDAAKQTKENAKAIAVHEDMELVFKGGEEGLDAFRRIGAQYGVPGDQVEVIAQRTFGDPDDDDDDEDVVDSYNKEASRTGKGDQGTRSHGKDPVDYSQLSPDLQRVLRETESARMDKIVDGALDKDEMIAYNMEAHTPEGRVAIRRYVDEKIAGRLGSFGGDFGDGTRILAEVLPEIREHLQALGIPAQRTHTSLGAAPGGGDTEIYPKKIPDHVPSSEGDAFEQNVLETMAYHQSQAERGRK